MTLKVHHLRPAPGAKTAKTRVGRGEGGKGKTAGRGTKGTKARVPGARPASRAGRCRCTCGCPSSRASRTPSGSSTRSSTWTGSPRCSPTAAQVGVDDLVAAGAVRKRPAGQGARHRRPRGRAAGHRARVLGVRQGEDRRGRRHGHDRALTVGANAAAASARGGLPYRPATRSGRSRRDVCGVRTSGAPGRSRAHVLPRTETSSASPRDRAGGPRAHRVRVTRSVRLTCARSCCSRWRSSRSSGSARSCRPRASTTRQVHSCINQVAGHLGDLRAGQPVQRRRAAAARRSSRSGSCRTSPRASSSSCSSWSSRGWRPLKKEGQAGQAKLTQYTRYLTIGLAILQSHGIIALARNPASCSRAAAEPVLTRRIGRPWSSMVLTMTAGTGADHVARRADHRPRHRQRHVAADLHLDHRAGSRPGGDDPARQQAASSSPWSRPAVGIVIIAAVVFVEQAQRRIPVQYAKRMVGRTDVRRHLDLHPAEGQQAGVIPVIFASSLLYLPQLLVQLTGNTTERLGSGSSRTSSRATSPLYLLTYFAADHLLHLLLRRRSRSTRRRSPTT